MTDRLKGRVAIVTGSGGGIGRAIAGLMASEGAKVVINDLGGSLHGEGKSAAPADTAVEEIRAEGGTSIANYEDVSDFEGAGRMVQAALDNFGRLDILVNNAGITRHAWLHEMTEQEWDVVVNVIMKGTFNCTRHASIPMRKQGYGRIVDISSPVGVIQQKGQAGGRRINYGAAKGGVFGFMNVACTELGVAGITVNCVLPGGAATRMSSASHSTAIKETKEEDPLTKALEGALTSLKLTPPEDLAPLAVYLCTEEANYINGHVFYSYGSTYSWFKPMEVTRQICNAERWTVDGLIDVMPRTLGVGLENPVDVIK